MARYVYLFLALISGGAAIWHFAFPGATSAGGGYQIAFALISLGAAVVFGSMFLANSMRRGKLRTDRLYD